MKFNLEGANKQFHRPEFVSVAVPPEFISVAVPVVSWGD